MKESILGFSVDNSDPATFLQNLTSTIWDVGFARRQCRWLACLNPHSFAMSKTDKIFCDALAEADWLIPDGIGVVVASKIYGGKIRRRITGSDVFEAVMQHLNANGGRVFFLGSTQQVLTTISNKIGDDFPNVTIAGTYSPPFKEWWSDQEIDEMISSINEVKPDVLWVGMTAPKQEKWIHCHKDRLNVPFVAAVGAVFDFYAGTVTRSSPCFRDTGMEWLPRLMREPGRLWRRVFLSAPFFFGSVIVSRIRSWW